MNTRKKNSQEHPVKKDNEQTLAGPDGQQHRLIRYKESKETTNKQNKYSITAVAAILWWAIVKQMLVDFIGIRLKHFFRETNGYVVFFVT